MRSLEPTQQCKQLKKGKCCSCLNYLGYLEEFYFPYLSGGRECEHGIGSGVIRIVRVLMVVVALAACGGRGGGSNRRWKKRWWWWAMQCQCQLKLVLEIIS